MRSLRTSTAVLGPSWGFERGAESRPVIAEAGVNPPETSFSCVHVTVFYIPANLGRKRIRGGFQILFCFEAAEVLDSPRYVYCHEKHSQRVFLALDVGDSSLTCCFGHPFQSGVAGRSSDSLEKGGVLV